MDIVLEALDTNADFVVFVDWLVGDGETVTAGSPVCLVETSKATVEVTTRAAGVLHHRAQAGDKVAVGAVIARVLADGEPDAPAARPPQPAAVEGRVSHRARE